MTAITVQIDDQLAEKLRRFAASQERAETEIVCDALAAYVDSARPLPKGMGKYRSGKTDVSEQARALLRQAVKDEQWP